MHLADRFVICVLWKKRPFVAPVQREVTNPHKWVGWWGVGLRIRGGPAGKIHCAVEKLQLSPGESDQLEDERVS